MALVDEEAFDNKQALLNRVAETLEASLAATGVAPVHLACLYLSINRPVENHDFSPAEAATFTLQVMRRAGHQGETYGNGDLGRVECQISAGDQRFMVSWLGDHGRFQIWQRDLSQS